MDKTTNTSAGLTAHDFGNNETHATGVTRTDGGWLALTLVESRTFKTERGAISWLARRGYSPDGSRNKTAA